MDSKGKREREVGGEAMSVDEARRRLREWLAEKPAIRNIVRKARARAEGVAKDKD